MEVTRDDFDEWKQNAVTREVFKVLQERKDIMAHALAKGGALLPEAGQIVGRYKEIDELLTWTYDDLHPQEEE